jgi:heme/copper-type cytochrome/quinol oxidase subunit 2
MKKNLFYSLLIALAGAMIAFAPLPVRTTSPQHRTFRMEAGQFSYAPAEITANPGDTITVELVSTDVVHGLYVDDYGVSVTADPGQTARLSFVADRTGSFRFRCNITCGAMHPFMIGKLNVGANISLWRALSLVLLTTVAAFVFFPRPASAKDA